MRSSVLKVLRNDVYISSILLDFWVTIIQVIGVLLVSA